MIEPLFTLTTAELDVLTTAHHRLLLGPEAPAGMLEGCGEDHEQASASLFGRGLLDADAALVEDDPASVLVTGILDLRLAADRTLVLRRFLGVPIADRTKAHERSSARIVHLVPEAASCLEDVHEAGLHTFSIVDALEDVVRVVTDFLVPAEAAPVRGCVSDGVRWPPGGRVEDLMTQLQHPTVLAEVCDVTLVEGQPRPGQEHLVALGPRGCFVATRPGHPPGVSGPGREEGVSEAVRHQRPSTAGLHFRPVGPTWVAQWATTILRSRGTMTG
ncbi:MAG: hypothetical protein Q4P07_04155 [Ornithinimicrobium sp.]|uniref:hypothetical protein n=1 Tax=Ornithinimicrobium sp. TaxID=1977084 RepID=UPI0026E03FA4|nr:hypothetical protein [Ornithinimicrobium sp.]MDO5739323.1 hypothetical protein [Ornithinimicrobium sp.]